MIINSKTTDVAIDKISTHPRNPRKGNLEFVKQSIEKNGFFGAVIVQESTGYILAGNHRFMAARELGFKKVPVTYVDVDDATATRILLADNRTSDLASYDWDVLGNMLKELDAADDIDGTGYDSHDVSRLLKNLDNVERDRGNANGENTSREIKTGEFKFEHECPKCGFEF